MKDDLVHPSLLSPMALREWPVFSRQSSVAETAAGLDTWSAGDERPRDFFAEPWVVGGAHVRHARGHEKALAVVMTVGADARGLLDDLHVGADAFRGDDRARPQGRAPFPVKPGSHACDPGGARLSKPACGRSREHGSSRLETGNR